MSLREENRKLKAKVAELRQMLEERHAEDSDETPEMGPGDGE